ncbi:putative CxxC motif protein [Halophage HF1]|uniref:CxxC motif protein n=2 Tax=Haloferacalesvirus TaxID=2843389 RepID=A0A6B9PAE3_9CAUD|nr:putative CxxC motif protein [Halorubrum phage HF2]YP_009725271.1 putative CxxC motif protein [Halophage HF1]AAL54926.1 putative CxxC motif protein [Halorubrum phage HF2]QHD55921.1 putative CxxC motif protein [Halophage HF1]QIR31162.1 putative CxxC motif protein [Halorubrum virus Hardycor2]
MKKPHSFKPDCNCFYCDLERAERADRRKGYLRF